ncbi:hypothetical protein D3C75_1272290 [compost metagenome]
MGAKHRPFRLTDVHLVAAITAEFVRTVKLSQLHATARQLEQPDILVNYLAYRAHIRTSILSHQPDRLIFPLADVHPNRAI